VKRGMLESEGIPFAQNDCLGKKGEKGNMKRGAGNNRALICQTTKNDGDRTGAGRERIHFLSKVFEKPWAADVS